MTDPVTPVIGPATQITVGGTAIVAAPAGPSGGFIVNPLLTADQGIPAAEVLYINPTGVPAGLTANGSTFALQPGQAWALIPGQTTQTYVNAATSGHKYSVVVY